MLPIALSHWTNDWQHVAVDSNLWITCGFYYERYDVHEWYWYKQIFYSPFPDLWATRGRAARIWIVPWNFTSHDAAGATELGKKWGPCIWRCFLNCISHCDHRTSNPSEVLLAELILLKQDHQALLKAKYCPQLSPFASAKSNRVAPYGEWQNMTFCEFWPTGWSTIVHARNTKKMWPSSLTYDLDI